MKILLIAKPWRGGLGRYFFMALEDIFPGQVEWISTRPQGFAERKAFHSNSSAWWDSLIEKIATTQCDAAFFIGYRKEFRKLQSRDNQVLYLIDDVCMAPGDADAFGKVFLSDPGYENELLAAMSPARYGGILPFGFCPSLHAPTGLRKPSRDLCFIGNRDSKRDPYLTYLFAEGLHPRVIGNYFMKSPLFWQHPFDFRPAVFNEAMGKIYARHKISLNVHAKVVREGTNMRTFECAGYGIPQVIEYRKGIENYFEPGKEILTYKTNDEMVAQIRFLLGNTVRAEAMAAVAQRRALAEHTYHHRVVTSLGHLLPEQILKQAIRTTA